MRAMLSGELLALPNPACLAARGRHDRASPGDTVQRTGAIVIGQCPHRLAHRAPRVGPLPPRCGASRWRVAALARTLRTLLESGRPSRRVAAIGLAWLVAFGVWPWLQIGNPLTQFKIAYVHFATISAQFEFDHWGERLSTTSLPWSYIPEQWFARLPVGFLALLASACLLSKVWTV